MVLGIGGLTGRKWHSRRALQAAEMLDEVVDSQLPLVTELSEESRRRSAEYLSELVMLAQDYRHFAAGWIDQAELERRGNATVARLEVLSKHRSPARLTEQD